MLNTGAPNIFIASALRSGSVHLSQSLCKVLGFRPARTNGLHGEGQEDQNVNPFTAAIVFPYGNQVITQHAKGTPINVKYVTSFNNSLIVLTRNIFDSLLSLKEWTNSLEVGIIPGLTMPQDWKKWDDDAQWNWLVGNALPWYTSFVYSWLSADVPKLWIDYDEYYYDQVIGMQAIFKHFGIAPKPTAKIEAETSRTTYMRTGESGRGMRIIPDYIRDGVYSHIDSWGPWSDLIRGKLL